MKQFAISVLATIVGGISLALLFVVGIMAFDHSAHWGPSSNTQPDPSLIHHPPGLNITQHSQVSDTDQFTIQGIVENKSNLIWYATEIVATVRSGGTMINECEDTIYGKLSPKSRRAFLIECKDTSSKAPQPLSYELVIVSARKGEG